MIPVRIRPAFWIFSAILSFFLANGSIDQAFVWMIIIFVSVLFHEYGHALTAKIFGRKPRIELVAMGGLTFHDGDKLPFWKQFLITLNGPLFGLILGLVCGYFYQTTTQPVMKAILLQMSVVNIFWTLVNLFPVLPLDGGQLVRIGLEKWLGVKGVKWTFIIGGAFALLASLVFFILQFIIAGAIFFLFAFENFDNYRKSRNITVSDRQDQHKTALMEAEALFRQGRKEEALQAFQALRAKTQSGMLYDVATQYTALILDDQGQAEEAYALLKPIQERLDPPTTLLFHRLAFEHQDDAVVAKIGAEVFQYFPLPEVALRNAYSAARQKQLEGAIGWLETAQQNGVENLKEIVQEHDFDGLRDQPEFREFVNKLVSLF